MADPMTKEEVFEFARLLGRLPQDQVGRLVAELQREQPDLYDYFQTLHRLFPDAREYDEVVGLGLTLWQILKRSAEPPGRVTVEMLYRAEEAYAAELKRLTAAPGEARQKAVTQATLNHPEPFVLAYLVLMIKKAGPAGKDETYILANNALRVLLDALLASRTPPRRPARPRATRHSTGRA